jgi:REP element-mobilizing transposase RayT
MLRGIDRQQIFEDASDYLMFLEILEDCRSVSGFQLFAYCLMGNHAHILLRVTEERLETIFKRIGGRYVYWHNAKYQRIGPLFQDRFKSEPVEDDSYFLTVLRYIHNNPVKAGLCRKPGEYPYSSYTAYLTASDTVDTEFGLGMLPGEEYARYHSLPNSDRCLEISETKRYAVTDDQARKIIEKLTHCRSISDFQSLEEPRKKNYTKKIHNKGVSIRQISRLTGISKGMVERWLKE